MRPCCGPCCGKARPCCGLGRPTFGSGLGGSAATHATGNATGNATGKTITKPRKLRVRNIRNRLYSCLDYFEKIIIEIREKQMKETEIHSYKANTGQMAKLPVACVAPVAEPCPPTWPPAWLAALSPPPETPRPVNLASLKLRGWRLPNGVVVWRHRCPRPPEAVPVLLADGESGPAWVEEPAATPCLATTSPTAAPLPEHPSKDLQWL